MNFTNILKDNSGYLLYKIIKNKQIFYYLPIISIEFCKNKIYGERAIKIVFNGILAKDKLSYVINEKYLYSWSYEKGSTGNTTELIFMALKSVCPFVECYVSEKSEPITIDVINTLNYFVCVDSNEKGGSSIRYNPLRCFYSLSFILSFIGSTSSESKYWYKASSL